MSRSACTVRYQGVSEPVDRDGLNGIESLPVPRGIGRAGRPSFPYWFVVLRHSSEAVLGSRAKAKGSVFRNAACEPAGTPCGARRAVTAAHQVQGCPARDGRVHALLPIAVHRVRAARSRRLKPNPGCWKQCPRKPYGSRGKAWHVSCPSSATWSAQGPHSTRHQLRRIRVAPQIVRYRQVGEPGIPSGDVPAMPAR